MLFRCVCVTVILISEAFVVFAQNRIEEECGKQTSENEYPWLVGIEFRTEFDPVTRIQCSGALISRRHVITNAACFDDLYYGQIRQSVRQVSNIIIMAGSCFEEGPENRCQGNNSIRVPIKMLIIHPNYNRNNKSPRGFSLYDIAVLKLHKTVLYTNFIRAICIPRSDITQVAETERDLYVAGLYMHNPRTKISGSLTYEDKNDCLDDIVAEDEICAEDVGLIQCLNLGGIIMNKRKDRYELVGLVTQKSRCLGTKIFPNLFLHLDWIRSDMTGWSSSPDVSWVSCGRRKVDYIELIVHGETSKIGDWPWHVAIYRLNETIIEYICGGTLISKTIVLTAAHCVTNGTEAVDPETLKVVLGKHYRIVKDLEAQEKEVYSLIVHENYAPTKHHANDIAIMKLITEATYTDYVQPACIWSSEANARLPADRDFGTVVGWGIDQSSQLASELQQTSMPIVSDIICIRKSPLFYTRVLENNKKFCAGWANGTSPCNGDSGGGFLVFVPDTAKDDSADAIGSWYIRGIVSITYAIRNKNQCDPYKYVVFTDIGKYTDWIQRYIVNQ